MCTIHVILPTKEVATFDATEAMITASMYDLEAVVVNYVGESVIGYGHKSNSMERRQPRTAALNPEMQMSKKMEFRNTTRSPQNVNI